MATIEENQRLWGKNYDWPQGGDEWSAPWGGTRNLWQHVILPRIQTYLPARTILEIAPGFGRWTQFLRGHCQRLVAIDISAKCVEHSKRRFADSPHVQVFQNDGRSIPVAENGSVDFMFSFDSLVHAEADTLQAYLQEIARVLAPGGAGFLHHSNIGEYRFLQKLSKRLPHFARHAAQQIYLFPKANWRAESVTAAWFAGACRACGLAPVKQEMINWRNGPFLIDCFTTFERSPGKPERRMRNRHFMREARRIRGSRDSDGPSPDARAPSG